MIQVPTESHLRTYFSIEIISASQRHPNIRKPLCVPAIHKSKTNFLLKMTMTPKNLHKSWPDSRFENILQHEKPQQVQTGAPARIASQCTSFHTARFSTKRCLQTDISAVIMLTSVRPGFVEIFWCHCHLQ